MLIQNKIMSPLIILGTFGLDISCEPGKEEAKQITTYGDNTETYNRLKIISEEIKASCGNICLTNNTGGPGRYYNTVWKDFDCDALFSNKLLDRYFICF